MGTPAASREKIEADHRELAANLERLESTTDLTVLISELEALRGALEEHFRLEEAEDGLYQVTEESAPHKVVEVQRLFEEHRYFIGSLDHLLASARSCLEGPLARVLRRTRRLGEQLRAHEAAEAELLEDALYTDLGGGD